MNHVPYKMYKCLQYISCLQFNNIATIIFLQNVRYFATERDDGRYVIIPATGRDMDRFYPKKQPHKFPNTFGEMKVFRQMWREQLCSLMLEIKGVGANLLYISRRTLNRWKLIFAVPRLLMIKTKNQVLCDFLNNVKYGEFDRCNVKSVFSNTRLSEGRVSLW